MFGSWGYPGPEIKIWQTHSLIQLRAGQIFIPYSETHKTVEKEYDFMCIRF